MCMGLLLGRNRLVVTASSCLQAASNMRCRFQQILERRECVKAGKPR